MQVKRRKKQQHDAVSQLSRPACTYNKNVKKTLGRYWNAYRNQWNSSRNTNTRLANGAKRCNQSAGSFIWQSKNHNRDRIAWLWWPAIKSWAACWALCMVKIGGSILLFICAIAEKIFSFALAMDNQGKLVWKHLSSYLWTVIVWLLKPFLAV